MTLQKDRGVVSEVLNMRQQGVYDLSGGVYDTSEGVIWAIG